MSCGSMPIRIFRLESLQVRSMNIVRVKYKLITWLQLVGRRRRKRLEPVSCTSQKMQKMFKCYFVVKALKILNTGPKLSCMRHNVIITLVMFLCRLLCVDLISLVFVLSDFQKPILAQDPHLSTISSMKDHKNFLIRSSYTCYIKTSAHEEAFKYMCGAAVSRYLQQCSECYECESLLCDEAPIQSFVQMRKYDIDSNLKYPSAECIKYLKVIDSALYRYLPRNIHKINLLNYLFNRIKHEVPTKLPSCELHKLTCENYILKIWIKMSIKIYCKDFMQKK